MTLTRRTTDAILGLLLVGCCGPARSPGDYSYELTKEANSAAFGSPRSFLVLSDTQYAEPFTDYDVNYHAGDRLVSLPPAVTKNFVTSFYRHAEAHLAMPYAMEGVIQKEVGKDFGLFGGDLVEFSCKKEADTMFEMLARQRALPFMITIGNHDALFHGSYDTDAVAMNGGGPWDEYSFTLWKYVCAHHGGPLTKSAYIARVLGYYETAWGFDVHKALGLEGKDFPLGVPLSGVVRGAAGSPKTRDWSLYFSFRLSTEDNPASHRQSYLYQRFVERASDDAPPSLTVTVLDTTDYGARPALCDPAARAVQIGMAGAVSQGQVKWLEQMPAPGKPALVLSHNVPFEGVRDGATDKDLDPCETTFGAHCLGARLSEALPGSTFVYGHVHRSFEPELVTSSANAEDTKPLVRLPSLMDNKTYVVFEQGHFEERALPVDERLQTEVPLSVPTGNTCEQRFREYTELLRNVTCLRSGAGVGASACPELKGVLAAASREGALLCSSLDTWKADHAAAWGKVEADCAGWTSESWRCVLQNLASAAVAEVPVERRPALGMKLLASVETRPKKE